MIDRTTQFKKDLKRERKGRHRSTVNADVGAIVEELANDRPLPAKNRDHSMSGKLHDCRDCHVKPDLVLIYRLIDADDPEIDPGSLELVRLGSHSELGI